MLIRHGETGHPRSLRGLVMTCLEKAYILQDALKVFEFGISRKMKGIEFLSQVAYSRRKIQETSNASVIFRVFQ